MSNPITENKTNHTRLLILLIVLLVILVVLALYYQELYQEDSYAHFLLAKYAWQHPRLFIDIWARPIPTLFFSLTAPFGIIPTKILTIIFSIVCAFLTYITAQHYKLKHAEFVIPFLIFQPYFLLLSINPLTEIFFATVLVASLLLFLQKRFLASTILCSLLPLVRPEGFFFLLFWFVMLLTVKKWRLIPLLGLGIVIWNLLGFVRTGDIIWLYHEFPWSGPQNFYGSGDIFNYIYLLPKITGILLPFFLIGFVYLIIQKQFRLAMIFIFFLFLHTTLWKFGLFKSSGYARYFVSIAPIIAIIGLYGYSLFEYLINIKKSAVVLLVFSVIFATVSVASILKIQSPKLDSDHQMLKQVHEYYQSLKSDAPLVCAYNYFFYIGNYDRYDFPNYPYPHLDSIRMHIDNSVVIWDSIYMRNQYGILLESLENLNFQKIKSFRSDNNYYPVKIFKSQ